MALIKLFSFFRRFSFTKRVALANFLIIHIPLIGTILLYFAFGAGISITWLIVSLVALTLIATLVSMLITKNLLRPFYLLDQAVKANQDDRDGAEEEMLADEIYRISSKTLKYIQKTKKRLKQQASLQTLLSHDLRGPSSSVISLCELAKGESDIDVLQEYLGMIGEASARQLKLQDELLQAQMLINSADPERLDFKELIENVVRDLALNIRKKKIRIETKISGSVSAMTWPIIVKEALHNLVENAVKFSNEGGQVLVSASFDGDHCLLEVKDQGMGIPKNLVDAVFYPNSPAGRKGTKGEPSSGNGLYLSRNLIRSIHGELGIAETEEGKGTTLRLSIPG